MKLHIYGSDFKIQNKLSFLPDILGLWHVKNVGKLQKNMSNCWYQFFKQECCSAEGAEVFHLYSHQGLLNLVILLSGKSLLSVFGFVCCVVVCLCVVTLSSFSLFLMG